MRKRSLVLGILLIVLLLIVAVSYISFDRNLKSHLQQSVETRLQEITEPNIVSFELQMEEQIKKVNTFADILGKSENLRSEESVALLQAAVKNNGLLRCALAFPDGSFITHDSKNEGSVANDAFFLANMKGEFFITDPRPAVVDPTKTVILFAAPIEKNDQIVGSVIYSYLCDDMDAIFNLDFLEGQGQMAAVKQDGQRLISSFEQVPAEEQNILGYLRSICTHEKHAAATCCALVGNEGSFAVSMAGNTDRLLVSYEKLNYNDWYMLSAVPESIATQAMVTVSNDQRDFTVVVGVCALIFLIAVLGSWLLERSRIDKLTGGLTLEAFKRTAKKIVKDRTHTYVFVHLDVKNFKLINRMYDFAEGDRVIKNIAEALRVAIPAKQTAFARVGTDDFVFVLPYIDRANLDAQREVFIETFKKLMGPDFTTMVEFPTGQYVLTDEDFPRPDITEILEKVNFAHHKAKQQTRSDTIIDYVSDIEKEALLEKAVEDKMSGALTREEFTLYLQPKVSLEDEKICGAEALVRWQVNGQLFMHPTDFIPVLERNGFIVKIDYYMFERAVEKVRTFLDEGETPIPISVNFSRYHLNNEKFVEELCEIADSYQVPHEYLEIELTESAVFENIELIVKLVDELHEAGFTMSMDDFGSGYSSLALLKEIKVDVLKIDKAFFGHTADSHRSHVVLSNVFTMAQQLEMKTVAEGVETKEQVEFLRTLNCDIVQGYYYARPIQGDTLHVATFLTNPEREALEEQKRSEGSAE